MSQAELIADDLWPLTVNARNPKHQVLAVVQGTIGNRIIHWTESSRYGAVRISSNVDLLSYRIEPVSDFSHVMARGLNLG